MPADTETPMIDIDGLTKTYGVTRALRDVNLHISRGECAALVGPNGAGKSTLIGVLSTLVRPTEGSARVAGSDVCTSGPEVRARLGVISHHTWLYDHLTAEENLSFFARLYGDRATERVGPLLAQFGLKNVARREAGVLSRGMRQRLSIARALLHDPPVLLLDEPFTGLDRHAAVHLQERILHLKSQGHTIVLVTHDLEDGWAVADRAVLLVRGEVRADMSVTSDGLSTFLDTLDRAVKGT